MRKICVVTSGRADYGLLYWLMKDLQAEPGCKLQVIATGMHLSPEFGLTYRQIETDGFQISERVENLLSSDSASGIAKSVGVGVIGFADALARLSPDIMVLLGDRFEILAAAIAAMTARIPIAHIHGGELTEGLIDEAIRHSITKMSHLHFVSANAHRQRVIQLGEDPARVFNFGAPGLDSVKRLALLDRATLENELQFRFGPKTFLVTYHPVTLSTDSPEHAITALLRAFDDCPDAHICFTQANADTNGRIVNNCINEYRSKNPARVFVYDALGQLKYLSLARQVDLVIGNSSSGLLEVPALGTPTINIGDRQKGRLRGSSVIDCSEKTTEILAAIKKGLSTDFRTATACCSSPYGSGNASAQIKDVVMSAELDGLVMKRFHDLVPQQ